MINEHEDTNCIYCGATAECREHVIPISYLGCDRNYQGHVHWIVPSCNSCNNLAGCNVFFCIPDKAKYILKRFKTKYRKVLTMPEWTEAELAELDYSLRTMTFAHIVGKRVANERLENLKITSDRHFDYEMPEFIKRKYKYWQERYAMEKKKLRRKPKKKNNEKHP